MAEKVVSSDYELLLEELNSKYFEKVCDIFDDAKNTLLAKLKDLLGEEYCQLVDEIKTIKDKAISVRENFDNQPYTAQLKEKLEVAKLEFVEANDQDRAEKKQALNAVLSEIAQRNIEVFSQMATFRKVIDDKTNLAMAIIKEREPQLKNFEKEVIENARNKTFELSVSYQSEVSALSYAFNVTEFSKEMPFLKSFDPNMRLIDFNKKAFMDAFNSKKQNCGPKCSGNCLSCHVCEKNDSLDKNYYKSENNDEFKN